ncbi:unnamed protein product [Lactuca virosa]|uniref:Uncharacterized protein n=1 Tax=Lactuca virosa TaxID=75947 RepID=A0AAU9P8C5_9ASTR|nr:unnamed protein product [Lactuca virosa]
MKPLVSDLFSIRNTRNGMFHCSLLFAVLGFCWYLFMRSGHQNGLIQGDTETTHEFKFQPQQGAFFSFYCIYIFKIQTSFRFSCIRPPNIGTNFAPFNHQSMSYSRYKVIAD